MCYVLNVFERGYFWIFVFTDIFGKIDGVFYYKILDFEIWTLIINFFYNLV